MSTSEVENLLNELVEKCQKGNYIYRGMPEQYDEVSSSLYRKHKDVFTDSFFPVHIEEEMVDGARRHFPDSASNIEILTELQHYGAVSTLIDFSHNLYVALFFACSEKLDKNGELILLNVQDIKTNTDVDYSRADLHASIIEPASTQQSQKRVTSQSSVFVHVPKGYLEKDNLSTHTIKGKTKRGLLKHLRKFHNISSNTIYDDLMGFISNKANYQITSFEREFYNGLAADEGKDYRKAIEYYAKAIELRPDNPAPYHNIGNAKFDLKQYDEAIEDYNKAIELKSDDARTYISRGNAEHAREQYDAAIEDYTRAIELKRDDAMAYYNRGNTKSRLKQYEAAIKDHDKAIELKPDYAEAYYSRGNTRFSLKQYEEAIKDYNKAIELKPDLAAAYCNRGRAKSDLKQYKAAVEDYDKAVELDPERESQLRPMIEELQTKITNNTDE